MHGRILTLVEILAQRVYIALEYAGGSVGFEIPVKIVIQYLIDFRCWNPL